MRTCEWCGKPTRAKYEAVIHVGRCRICGVCMTLYAHQEWDKLVRRVKQPRGG